MYVTLQDDGIGPLFVGAHEDLNAALDDGELDELCWYSGADGETLRAELAAGVGTDGVYLNALCNDEDGASGYAANWVYRVDDDVHDVAIVVCADKPVMLYSCDTLSSVFDKLPSWGELDDDDRDDYIHAAVEALSKGKRRYRLDYDLTRGLAAKCGFPTLDVEQAWVVKRQNIST